MTNLEGNPLASPCQDSSFLSSAADYFLQTDLTHTPEGRCADKAASIGKA